MTLYKEMKSCKCILGSVQHVWLIGVFLLTKYGYSQVSFVFEWADAKTKTGQPRPNVLETFLSLPEHLHAVRLAC